jgi:predicted MFS family arabinose efflux permease
MLLIGGWLGIIGNVVAGRLADRYGRRLVGAAMLMPFPLFAWLFFQGPAQIVAAPWIAMVFVSQAANVILRALAVELFPTSMRSSAGGWLLLVETLGAGAGLFLYAELVGIAGSWGVALSLVSAVAGVGAIFLLFLPDTHRRELEVISG